MPTYYKQKPATEREGILSLIDNREMSVRKGAMKLDIPYTTIMSRIHRGSTMRQAFMKPIQKRTYYSNSEIGNAVWKALGD